MHNNPVSVVVEHGPWRWVWFSSFTGKQKSVGISQIQMPTARNMLSLYGEWFTDLGLPIDKDSSNYDIGEQLYYNEEFNIRVAGAYLAHIRHELEKDMQGYHVVTVNEEPQDTQITVDQFEYMVVIGYNQGLGGAIHALQDRYNKGGARKIAQTLEDASRIPPAFDVSLTDSSIAEMKTYLEEKFHVKVSDVIIKEPHVDTSVLKWLTALAQTEDWDQLIDEWSKEFEVSGAKNVVDGVDITLRQNEYDENVYGMWYEALHKYGLRYERKPYGS